MNYYAAEDSAKKEGGGKKHKGEGKPGRIHPGRGGGGTKKVASYGCRKGNTPPPAMNSYAAEDSAKTAGGIKTARAAIPRARSPRPGRAGRQLFQPRSAAPFPPADDCRRAPPCRR